MDDINENVGLTNESTLYSMLLGDFKEMTNNLEGHYTVKLSIIEEKGKFVSVTLSFSKKKKTHGSKHN